MTPRFLFPAVLFLLLLQMSCAGPSMRMPAEEAPQPLPSQPPDYVPKKAYDLGFIPAWEGALQSLRETNIPLTTQDRDKGIIRTDYIKGAEIRRLEKAFSTRYKYNIFLFRESEKRTILNVRCLYEIKEKSGQSFGNANDLYPDEVIVLEKELYRIIESTLSRAEASRPPGPKAEEKEKAPAPQAPSPTASWPVFPPETARVKAPSSPPPASVPAIPEAPKPRGTPPVSSREAQDFSTSGKGGDSHSRSTGANGEGRHAPAQNFSGHQKERQLAGTALHSVENPTDPEAGEKGGEDRGVGKLGAGENLGNDDRMDFEGPAPGSPPLKIADFGLRNCRLKKRRCVPIAESGADSRSKYEIRRFETRSASQDAEWRRRLGEGSYSSESISNLFRSAIRGSNSQFEFLIMDLEVRRLDSMSQKPDKVIYTMMEVGRYYDKKPVLQDISLGYFYGAKIGVIGLNGSGKSSLLRIMAGVDKEFVGQTILSPGYSIGFLEQEPRLDDSKTVREIVEEGVKGIVDLLKEFEKINEKFAEPMSDDEMNKLLERQGQVQEKLDAQGAWDLDSRLEMAMDALRCPPGDTPVKILSGGERRRVALCRLLLQKPDILLLDEPTNHLDAETVGWLEAHLQQYPGTVIAVTHDRYFLDNVAGWILELDRGRGIPWKGNYSSWLEQKRTRLQQEEKAETARQKTLQRELEWIRMAPKARQAKGKARINAYEALLSQETEKRREDLEIYIPPGPRLGNLVMEAKDLSKAYGEKLLFEGMNFTLPPGGIVGVIGPNGAGKTTLFRVITSQEKADRGTIRIGETVKLAYVDQSRDLLDPEKSIWQEISGGQDTIDTRKPGGELPGLRGPIQLPRYGAAEKGGFPLRRREEPGSPGQDAEGRRQRHPAGRAYQ